MILVVFIYHQWKIKSRAVHFGIQYFFVVISVTYSIFCHTSIQFIEHLQSIDAFLSPLAESRATCWTNRQDCLFPTSRCSVQEHICVL